VCTVRCHRGWPTSHPAGNRSAVTDLVSDPTGSRNTDPATPLYPRWVGLRPLTRIVLIAIGLLIIAYDSNGFAQSPGLLSGLAAFFFLLPGLFGGVSGPP
jgi:hypothetical protein